MKTTIQDRQCFLTTQELAEHFRISARSIHRWKSEGILPFYRIGPKMIRFDLDEVNQALGVEKHDAPSDSRRSRLNRSRGIQ